MSHEIPVAPRQSMCQSLRTRRARGFTIVEILVVTGIIALLVGILLPALSGVQKRSRKAVEMNNIKQVGHAWMMYGTNNNDAALPGFLAEQVQRPPVSGVSRGWAVLYEYPDGKKIPIDATNVSGPWTWRLLSYLGYDHELVHGYLNEDDADVFTLKAEAEEVAYEPAFGYNGYYIGGYWEMTQGTTPTYPVFRFYNHCDQSTADPSKPRLIVPTTIGQIRRSSEMVTFCSSSKFTDGPTTKGKLPADHPGAHLVAGPIVGDAEQWKPDAGNNLQIVASGDVYSPLARHTGTIAVLWADGHTDQQTYHALYDQYKWINSASSKLYKHAPCP